MYALGLVGFFVATFGYIAMRSAYELKLQPASYFYRPALAAAETLGDMLICGGGVLTLIAFFQNHG